MVRFIHSILAKKAQIIQNYFALMVLNVICMYVGVVLSTDNPEKMKFWPINLDFQTYQRSTA